MSKRKRLYGDVVQLKPPLLRHFRRTWNRIHESDRATIRGNLDYVGVGDFSGIEQPFGKCHMGRTVFLAADLSEQEDSRIMHTIAHELAHVWQAAVVESLFPGDLTEGIDVRCLQMLNWRLDAEAELLVARWGCGSWEDADELFDDDDDETPYLYKLLIAEELERQQNA